MTAHNFHNSLVLNRQVFWEYFFLCDHIFALHVLIKVFALYLNDLQDHLAKAYNGLFSPGSIIQDTVVYLKLLAILYADDTVIFSESRDELQAVLYCMKCCTVLYEMLLHYCNLWKLDINAQKTNVFIYGSKCKAKAFLFTEKPSFQSYVFFN